MNTHAEAEQRGQAPPLNCCCKSKAMLLMPPTAFIYQTQNNAKHQWKALIENMVKKPNGMQKKPKKQAIIVYWCSQSMSTGCRHSP